MTDRRERCTEWTTRLDPSITRRNGVEELHSAWWVPPQYSGQGTVVGLSIPECELTIAFVGRDGIPVVMLNRPRANRGVKGWLHFACKQAVKWRAALHIGADTAEQIERAAKMIARLLPHYERVALERMYDPATRARSQLLRTAPVRLAGKLKQGDATMSREHTESKIKIPSKSNVAAIVDNLEEALKSLALQGLIDDGDKPRDWFGVADDPEKDLIRGGDPYIAMTSIAVTILGRELHRLGGTALMDHVRELVADSDDLDVGKEDRDAQRRWVNHICKVCWKRIG